VAANFSNGAGRTPGVRRNGAEDSIIFAQWHDKERADAAQRDRSITPRFCASTPPLVGLRYGPPGVSTCDHVSRRRRYAIPQRPMRAYACAPHAEIAAITAQVRMIGASQLRSFFQRVGRTGPALRELADWNLLLSPCGSSPTGCALAASRLCGRDATRRCES
jgi:hypothetical protein